MTWGATSARLYLLDVLITAKDSDSDSDSDVEDAVKARRKLRAKFNGKPTVWSVVRQHVRASDPATTTRQAQQQQHQRSDASRDREANGRAWRMANNACHVIIHMLHPRSLT